MPSLVLSRKVGERIRIGDDIIVQVTEIQHGNKVRILVDAPRVIPVHREEVYLEIQRKQTGNKDLAQES